MLQLIMVSRETLLIESSALAEQKRERESVDNSDPDIDYLGGKGNLRKFIQSINRVITDYLRKYSTNN